MSIIYCSLINIFYMSYFFFFNDTATTEIYTLSLHDALPILAMTPEEFDKFLRADIAKWAKLVKDTDRKSTRLNSSHPSISYAVFCLKKKKKSYIRLWSDQSKDLASTHCRSPYFHFTHPLHTS